MRASQGWASQGWASQGWAALKWAERLGQTVPYDAHCLALAQFLGCELWTADELLVSQLTPDIPWVHRLGDMSFA